MNELAVIPVTTVAIEAGTANIERCRLLHNARRLVDAEFALRVKAELDGPGSKTQQQVADEIGCDQSTISKALDLIGAQRHRPKITNYDEGITDDLEPQRLTPIPPEDIVEGELVDEEEQARRERLRQAAADEERKRPDEPIAVLLSLQTALRAAVAQVTQFKNAGRELTAAQLTDRITLLCREMENLLCP